jgi:hypothetical protein
VAEQLCGECRTVLASSAQSVNECYIHITVSQQCTHGCGQGITCTSPVSARDRVSSSCDGTACRVQLDMKQLNGFVGDACCRVRLLLTHNTIVKQASAG